MIACDKVDPVHRRTNESSDIDISVNGVTLSSPVYVIYVT